MSSPVLWQCTMHRNVIEGRSALDAFAILLDSMANRLPVVVSQFTFLFAFHFVESQVFDRWAAQRICCRNRVFAQIQTQICLVKHWTRQREEIITNNYDATAPVAIFSSRMPVLVLSFFPFRSRHLRRFFSTQHSLTIRGYGLRRL